MRGMRGVDRIAEEELAERAGEVEHQQRGVENVEGTKGETINDARHDRCKDTQRDRNEITDK